MTPAASATGTTSSRNSCEPAPKLFRRRRRNRAGRHLRIDDHVPRHAARHRRIDRAVHPDRHRLAAGKPPGHAATDAGDAEVVAHDRNAGLAEPTNDRLAVLQMLALLRPIEQHIVPMSRIEILNRLELEARLVDLPPERHSSSTVHS